jgi:glutaredoxin
MEPLQSISIAGYSTCGYHKRALRAANAFFGASTVNDRTFSSRAQYKQWLQTKDGLQFSGRTAAEHTSSPFVWINKDHYVGGCDDTLAWISKLRQKAEAAAAATRTTTKQTTTTGNANAETPVSFLSTSTFQGQSMVIPASPMKAHLAAITAAKNEHPAATLFILYIGQADANGNSWCPDCNDIKTVLSTIPANSILLECQVTRNEWKINPGSDHPLRSRRFLPVSGVPCLMKMGSSRPVASLVESQMNDPVLLSALMKV